MYAKCMQMLHNLADFNWDADSAEKFNRREFLDTD